MNALLLTLLLARLEADPEPPDAVRWDEAGAVPAVAGITPGRDGLDAVRRAFGDAPRVEGSPGDRDLPAVRLCFVAPDGGDETILIFDAQYDARGEVVEAWILSDAAPPEVAACATSARVWRGLEASNGLRLGMARGEVLGRIGPPTEQLGGTVAWERWTGRVDARGTGWDGYEGMRLLFHGERLVAIEAFRAEWRRP